MNQTRSPKLYSQPWTRSEDGWIAGVCEGIGRQLDVNPGLIRLFWLGSVLFFGVGFLLYFIFAFCLPVEGNEEQARNSRFLGVCSRLAEKTEIDLGLIRVATVIIALSSFGATLIFYLLLHFLLEKEPTNKPNY